ncbi:MAG: holo-ACP synthase [Clostridia bacterium]
MKIGIDSVEIQRFDSQSKSFYEKIFTIDEQLYIQEKNNELQTIAGIYAVKEAILKALGVGIFKGVPFIDINIKHYENGQPYAVLYRAALIEMQKYGECLEISITHTHQIASAVAIIH